jgi:hypothetical protein
VVILPCFGFVELVTFPLCVIQWLYHHDLVMETLFTVMCVLCGEVWIKVGEVPFHPVYPVFFVLCCHICYLILILLVVSLNDQALISCNHSTYSLCYIPFSI